MRESGVTTAGERGPVAVLPLWQRGPVSAPWSGSLPDPLPGSAAGGLPVAGPVPLPDRAGPARGGGAGCSGVGAGAGVAVGAGVGVAVAAGAGVDYFTERTSG
ncbi:hypothetical protein ACFWA9_30385 [Kitasatospora sp. NPDC059973]|uniref:hypothetical protein n=1 Tax=unclassified Kitasatospora TaxID=2633591 RepID=UPI00332B712D